MEIFIGSVLACRLHWHYRFAVQVCNKRAEPVAVVGKASLLQIKNRL